MFIFLFSFLCLLLASSIVTSKQIILLESNDTKVTLQTESPSFLTIQNHQYKRQLLSSIQVLDLGKYALLKHNLMSKYHVREAPVSKKCSFFEQCSNGGGVNPCSKIMSEIVVCSGGHLTT